MKANCQRTFTVLRLAPPIPGCRYPFYVDYSILSTLSVKLLLVDYNENVVSSATDALVGSPQQQFTVPINDEPFSILFRNEDAVVCKQWRIVGFRITVENAKWYKVRIGRKTSRRIEVHNVQMLLFKVVIF